MEHLNWKTEVYSTHQPFLMHYLMKTSGPVLELGCGHGSTHLLHAYCEKANRPLLTVENDYDWMSKFLHYQTKDHQFMSVGKAIDHEDGSPWNIFLDSKIAQSTRWGLVFIDQSPWNGRTRSIQKLKDNGDILLVHDADFFPHNGIFGTEHKPVTRDVPGEYTFDDIFNCAEMYWPPTPWPGYTGPPTLVGSQIISLDHPSMFTEEYINELDIKMRELF